MSDTGLVKFGIWHVELDTWIGLLLPCVSWTNVGSIFLAASNRTVLSSAKEAC